MYKKILIVGASSDMGFALLSHMDLSNFIVGALCYKGRRRLDNFIIMIWTTVILPIFISQRN